MSNVSRTKIGLIAAIPGNVMNLYRALSSCSNVDGVEIIQEYPNTTYETLILPGVGHFQDAIEKLYETKLDEYIKNHVTRGGKLIGICLGMQLLFEKSEEVKSGSSFTQIDGLGILKGRVVKLNSKTLPHIGWNSISVKNSNSKCELSKYDNRYFYFVHSYKALCDDELIVAKTEYDGEIIPAIVKYENVIGIQFHPEKSHKDGLALLNEVVRC